MQPLYRGAALLAVLTLLGLLPLRGGHVAPQSQQGSPVSLIAAQPGSGAADPGAPLHDEGSCAACRALRDARTLAAPGVADCAVALPAAPAQLAERDPFEPCPFSRGSAAPRAPPLA